MDGLQPQSDAIHFGSGSFASLVPALRSAPARNRTLQTFNEPLSC